ncbi:Bowman-Birk type trypsin inhibitor [Rhynchospora pubera]|uniref:Bowman-Birk type trypsin inhibitor n=1 Tax=Rhynchospora pubera TaxID=906938 RepID=A0AAV8EAG0_9POAL|nr:Bowman-Birk type trypsin inhibitor [Rhynchospora pubera]
MGRIATSSPSSFNFVFIIVMLSLFLPLALARSSLPSRSDPHDLLSAIAAKQVGSWPCCDDCGLCDVRAYPPRCMCNDLHEYSCPSECKSCVQEVGFLTPMYRCMDFIVNFCENSCYSVINQ